MNEMKCVVYYSRSRDLWFWELDLGDRFVSCLQPYFEKAFIEKQARTLSNLLGCDLEIEEIS